MCPGLDKWSWKLVKSVRQRASKLYWQLTRRKSRKRSRTLLEVVLGDDPVPGKKEQDLLEKQKIKDSRTTMLKKLLETIGENDTVKDFRDVVKHDLETATEPQSKAKASIAGIEVKLVKIEREETRLIDLEAGTKKAEVVLKERLDSLDGERVLLAKTKAGTTSKHGHECKNGHRCEFG